MYFLHAINSDRQTRLLNVLGEIAMVLGDKKNTNSLVKVNYPEKARPFRIKRATTR